MTDLMIIDDFQLLFPGPNDKDTHMSDMSDMSDSHMSDGHMSLVCDQTSPNTQIIYPMIDCNRLSRKEVTGSKRPTAVLPNEINLNAMEQQLFTTTHNSVAAIVGYINSNSCSTNSSPVKAPPIIIWDMNNVFHPEAYKSPDAVIDHINSRSSGINILVVRYSYASTQLWFEMQCVNSQKEFP